MGVTVSLVVDIPIKIGFRERGLSAVLVHGNIKMLLYCAGSARRYICTWGVGLREISSVKGTGTCVRVT